MVWRRPVTAVRMLLIRSLFMSYPEWVLFLASRSVSLGCSHHRECLSEVPQEEVKTPRIGTYFTYVGSPRRGLGMLSDARVPYGVVWGTTQLLFGGFPSGQATPLNVSFPEAGSRRTTGRALSYGLPAPVRQIKPLAPWIR